MMRTNERYNSITLIGFIVILIFSISYLIINFNVLLGYPTEPIYELPKEIISLINVFIFIILFMVLSGIFIAILQFNKGFNLIRWGELISFTFSLNIIAIFAILKIQSVTNSYYTDAFAFFLSYIGFTIFLNCISFFGSLIGIIKEKH